MSQLVHTPDPHPNLDDYRHSGGLQWISIHLVTISLILPPHSSTGTTACMRPRPRRHHSPDSSCPQRTGSDAYREIRLLPMFQVLATGTEASTCTLCSSRSSVGRLSAVDDGSAAVLVVSTDLYILH